MDWELEEVARDALEVADVGSPVRPRELARRLGFTVRDAGPRCGGLLLPLQRVILVDESERVERRAFAVAHELAHFLLRCRGLETAGTPYREAERQANYLASALLLPRDDFDRDLRTLGWDLFRLRSRHRWASFEALARRVVSLRGARAFVFDRPTHGRPRWYSVPSGLRPSPGEREAAAEAAQAGAPVEAYAGVWGWPVLQHDWARVIVLSS